MIVAIALADHLPVTCLHNFFGNVGRNHGNWVGYLPPQYQSQELLKLELVDELVFQSHPQRTLHPVLHLECAVTHLQYSGPPTRDCRVARSLLLKQPTSLPCHRKTISGVPQTHCYALSCCCSRGRQTVPRSSSIGPYPKRKWVAHRFDMLCRQQIRSSARISPQ